MYHTTQPVLCVHSVATSVFYAVCLFSRSPCRVLPVYTHVLLTAGRRSCGMVGLSVWHSCVNMYGKASKAEFYLWL